MLIAVMTVFLNAVTARFPDSHSVICLDDRLAWSKRVDQLGQALRVTKDFDQVQFELQ